MPPRETQNVLVVTPGNLFLQKVFEANPLVRSMMQWSASPLVGLGIAKGLAVALALYCWRAERVRLLGRANLFFAVVVTWNLIALILGTARLVRP